MTKSTVHTDKDSLQKKEAAAHAALPELFKAGSPIIVDTKKLKPLSLETAGSELYAAVMNGEMHTVRGMLGHADRVTENEALMMIRTRNKAREKGARRQQMLVECAEKNRKKKKDINQLVVQVAQLPKKSRVAVLNPKGAAVARGGIVVDGFGGTYTSGGYEMADGSFLSITGDFFNAQNKTVTLASGQAYQLSGHADMNGAELMRAASLVQSILFSNSDNDIDFLAPTVAAIKTYSADTPAPAAPAAAVVADANRIQEAAQIERAEAVMATENFTKEAKTAPAAALGQLADDSQQEITEEALRIALHLLRKERNGRRYEGHGFSDEDYQEILQIRDGMVCVDKGAIRRCHHGHHSGIAALNFNPASRPGGQIDFEPVMAGIRAYFQNASAKEKPEAPAVAYAKVVIA